MIPAITEVNFPSYATLHQATVSLQDMGDRVISTQVRIDGDVVPDFSGWELRFKGERFVLPSDNPQAMKDNTTRNSLVDLQFQSWAIQELKRYYFFEAASVSAGVAIADKYVAPVRLNVEDFVAMLNDVLDYYFDGKIVADLYLSGTGIYSQEKKDMEINYSYLWEVIGKVFEVYGVRNVIEYDSTNDVYTIKFGYPADEIDDHTFEYGYQGGLLKFERQVQDETISNILLGRGGEKNLPYRYFKRADPQNPEWAADPDAIPELANIYFDRLRDINFRRYVQGWRTNPNRDTSWEAVQAYDATRGATDWAYKKGHEDEKFSPVEYVKDDESIAAYGEHWGALDDNDEIFPTIQGRSRTGLGRIDEVVAVSPITTDDIQAMAQASSVEKSISPLTVSKYGSTQTTHIMESEEFTIPEGSIGNITYAWVDKATLYEGSVYCDTANSSLVAVSAADGTELPISGIPAGTYRLKLTLVIRIDSPATSATGTFGLENIVLKTSAQDDEAWKPTFDIWVKDIWGISRNPGESDVQYAMRVWGPILGDRVGNEAKVVFSTGFMAVSEDYEFTIADYPVPDTTKTLNGVPSAWRITLRKSDAEYDATGLYIPNNSTGGKPIAGDKFFFTGIDMPHLYVTLAEEELNTFKSAQLQGTSAVNPTWVISLDKVRVHTLEDGEYGQTLAERLAAGAKLRVSDPRFSGGDILTLHAQSVTYTWNEPSDGSPYIVPDIEVVLSDQVVSRESRVDKIQSSVEQIKSQYARIDDVESVVRKVAEPMFLKKTGEADSSDSPTQFASKVTSRGFRQGGVGGTGWGFYRDNTEDFAEGEEGEGDTVLEVDRMVVRKEMQVNSLVVNQVEYRGGMEIISAAKIEISKVIETSSRYICYFDQRQNSVANNFVVGDIAYGQVFTPQNSSLRYYKCRVEAVDVDRIELSKTVKDGAGVPQAGDVVVQYGNYTNASRQFVIIRDVVGGGYERMISDLDSVDADGEEYYFAGRQSGQNPRWFVGDAAGEYAEWKNGLLNIKGRLTVLNDQGAYVAMDSYMNSVSQQFATQQAQIDGQTQSWASGEAPASQTKPYPLWDEQTQQIIGTPNYPYTQWQNDTERAKHVGDTYVDDTTGQSYRLTKKTTGGTTVYYWTRVTDEAVSQAISTSQQAYAAAEGLQYLKAATNEGTLVEGGLVLTSMIQLGYTPQGGSYTVMSGINGKPNTQLQDPAKSIAAWFGGAMVDHETYPAVSDYAKSLFRMDGSGYLAGGNIGWQADGDGHIPGISWETVGGVTNVTIGANVKLAQTGGTDSSVTDLVSAVQGFPNDYVSIATAQTVTGKKTFSHTDGITIGGATLKWVAGTGGNPGYLQINSALLTLGDQIVGSGTPGGGGGGAGYLYELGDIYHDTDKTKVLRTDGTTPAAVGDVLQLTSLTGGNRWAAIPATDIGRVYSGGTGITINGNEISVTANTYAPYNSAGYLPLSAGSGKALTGDLYLGNHSITNVGSITVSELISWGSTDQTTWNISDPGIRVLGSVYSAVTGSPGQYFTGFSVFGYYGFQLASNSNSNTLKFRSSSHASGTYADWVTILHSGNYTSYTLALTGGTINTLTVGSSSDPHQKPLTINAYGSGNTGYIKFINGSTVLGSLGVSAVDTPAFMNAAGTAYTIYHSGNFTPSDYLPLVGGYIQTGTSYARLRLVTTSSVAYIQALTSSGNAGSLYLSGGVATTGTTIDFNFTNVTVRGSYDVWHSGNDSRFMKSNGAVTSSTDANTLIHGIWFNNASTTNFPAQYGELIAFDGNVGDSTYGGYYVTQLFRQNGNVLKLRTKDGSTWRDWVTLYHSGNSNSTSVAWSASSLTLGNELYLQNNYDIYWKDSGGVYRSMAFLSAGNSFVLGSGLTSAPSGGYLVMRAAEMRFQTCARGGTLSDRIWINSSGNVTIGTSDLAGTNYRLYINGGTYSNGNITVSKNSIKFNTTTDTDWNIGVGTSETHLRILNTVGSAATGGSGNYDVALSIKGYYGFQIACSGATNVFKMRSLSNGAGIPRAWVTMWHDGNSGTSSYDWNCKNLTANGTITSTGDQVISSDERLKTIVKPVDMTVEQLAGMRAVIYDRKDSGVRSLGVIAQDWEEVLPESVNQGEYLTFKYAQTAMVSAIVLAKHETEQDKEIKKLREKVQKLEEDNLRLKARLNMN